MSFLPCHADRLAGQAWTVQAGLADWISAFLQRVLYSSLVYVYIYSRFALLVLPVPISGVAILFLTSETRQMIPAMEERWGKRGKIIKAKPFWLLDMR